MLGRSQLGLLSNPRTVTISGHGDTATDKCNAIRNPTGSAGDIRVRFAAGSTDHTFSNVQAGDTIPTDQIDRIYETSTTLATVEIFDLI